jgi:phosphomannomutase
LEGVEGEPVNVTPEAVQAIAHGFAHWVKDKKEREGPAKPDRKYRISIGHDSRLSAKSLREAAGRGIASAGFDVVQY